MAPDDKVWRECMALGKKLDGMYTHARSIESQVTDSANDWHWAKDEVSPLAIDGVLEVRNEWNAAVRTSTLSIMKQKKGDTATLKYLKQLKTSIGDAVSQLQVPLGELVGMHNERLKRRAKAEKDKAAKKVKLESAGECKLEDDDIS